VPDGFGLPATLKDILGSTRTHWVLWWSMAYEAYGDPSSPVLGVPV